MENPTANFKPCIDWEMAEETFGEAQQPEEPSQPADTQPFAPPPFTCVATRKLQELLAEGYKITGYCIDRQSDDPTAVEPKRGFCTAGGFVGWWHRDTDTGQIWPVAAEGDGTEDKRPAYLVSNSTKNPFYGCTEPTAEKTAAKFLLENPRFDQAIVGEADYPKAHYFVSATKILEEVNHHAYYTYSESSGDWLINLILSDEKCAELKKLVGDWIESQEPPPFFKLGNIKKFTRAELLESGHFKNEQGS